MSRPTEPVRPCPRCGAPRAIRPDGSPAACARCDALAQTRAGPPPGGPPGGGRLAAAAAAAAGSLPPEVVAALADPSRRIGRHVVLGELGRGGMGVVHRGYDPSLRRPVAIKVIRDPQRAGARRLERFAREATATARLRHPGIVAVHEVGEHEGRPFIVMDLVEGESLEALLRREKLPPRRIAAIVEALAHALHHAHAAGIVHRDVKPENVIVDRGGAPLLMDFGLARDVEEQKQLTMSGELMGTPVYMAPEQASGRAGEQGPSTDVYSLGAVLYRMLTGVPPFEGATLFELIRRVVSVEPVPARERNPAVHPDLDTIADRCLQKRPEARYADAAALAEDLRRFGAGEPILARPVVGLERLRRGLRRHRLAATAVGLAVLAGVGAGAGALVFRAAERRAAVADAWERGERARARFDDLTRADPIGYREAHRAALDALAGLDRVLGLQPDHPRARAVKHEVAVRFGELALARDDFGLASTMFSAAAGLGVDDAAARAGLARVEQARAAKERPIREGLHELFDLFEKVPVPEADGNPAGAYLRSALAVVKRMAALAGGTPFGARVLFEACREVVLDPERPGESRVLAGVVLTGTPAPPRADAYAPLVRALAGDDDVAVVVAAHALAVTRDPRHAEPLRRAWLAVSAPDGTRRRAVAVEIARAMLIHGDALNVALIGDGLLEREDFPLGEALFDPETPDARGTATTADFDGTFNAATAGLYRELFSRGRPELRWHIATTVGAHRAGLALAPALRDILLEDGDAPRLPGWRFELDNDFTFDALYAPVVIERLTAAGGPASAAWMAARQLVRLGAAAELLAAVERASAPFHRGIACLGLGEVGEGERARSALVRGLADEDAWVRACAAAALARRGDPAGVGALELAVLRREEPSVRMLTRLRLALVPWSPLTPLASWSATFASADARVIGFGPADVGAVGGLFASLGALFPPGHPPPMLGIVGLPGEPGLYRALAVVGDTSMPFTVKLLGRTPATLRASSLRSEVAFAALDDIVAGSSRPRRKQAALRLMAQLQHPRASEHARALLEDPDHFVQVEAVRTLFELGEPDAPALLAKRRARWEGDPRIALGLDLQVRVETPVATAAWNAVYSESLLSSVARLARYPTAEAVGEVAAWIDHHGFEMTCFAVLDAIGPEKVLELLPQSSCPPGKAAYLEGWLCLARTGDRARARSAFARAVEGGYGVPRAHVVLGWLELTDPRGDAARAREHLLAARRAGGVGVRREATFWLGWVDLFRLHRPDRAEAAFREVIGKDAAAPGSAGVAPGGVVFTGGGGAPSRAALIPATAATPALPAEQGAPLPPPAGPLPELGPPGPGDTPVGPWPRSRAGDRGPFSPDIDPLDAARAGLVYILVAERGDLAGAVGQLGVMTRHSPVRGAMHPAHVAMYELAYAQRSPAAFAATQKLIDGIGVADDPVLAAWKAFGLALEGRSTEAARRLAAIAGDVDAPPDAGRIATWLIGRVGLLHGESERTAGWLGEALRRDPGNPRVLRDLAAVLAAGGRLEEAIEQARQAATIDPWLAMPAGGTVTQWLVAAIERLLAQPSPDDPGARARRLAALRRVAGDDAPEDPAAAAAWWRERAPRVRWDRAAGRFTR